MAAKPADKNQLTFGRSRCQCQHSSRAGGRGGHSHLCRAVKVRKEHCEEIRESVSTELLPGVELCRGGAQYRERYRRDRFPVVHHPFLPLTDVDHLLTSSTS